MWHVRSSFPTCLCFNANAVVNYNHEGHEVFICQLAFMKLFWCVCFKLVLLVYNMLLYVEISTPKMKRHTSCIMLYFHLQWWNATKPFFSSIYLRVK